MHKQDDQILDLDPELELSDPDALLADLLEEFGDGARPARTAKAKPAARHGGTPPPPPAQRWQPVARTLRVLRQLCSCGCEHTTSMGVFLEEISLSSTARRYVPYNPSAASLAQQALPSRTEMDYQQIPECHLCFGIEEKLRPCRNTSEQFHLDFAAGSTL